LEAAAGVIAMLIADEAAKFRPIVVSGTGPQVRVYTVHGHDAVDGANVSEAALAQSPTAGTWTLTLPVPDDDLDWVTTKMSAWPHIAVSGAAEEAKSASIEPSAAVPVIDLSELRRV
jgi:hypothetical protein